MSEVVIQELWEADGGGLIGHYAKGHHDPAAFLEAVTAYLERDPGYEVEHVRREYWRNIPARDGSDGWWLRETPGPARGAYKVTVYDADEVAFKKAWAETERRMSEAPTTTR